MSLIVLQHTVVDAFSVDPTASPSSRIVQGCIVGINQSGYLSLPSSAAFPLGIAGDNFSDEYKTTAYSAQLVVSPSGAKRWTSNRVSDMFNETLASGKMSVYIGSGRFATDQYLPYSNGSANTYTVGAPLYATSTGAITPNVGTAGTFGARVIGYVAAAPASYPSGVPGADTGVAAGAPFFTENGTSMTLGTFLTFHLSI